MSAVSGELTSKKGDSMARLSEKSFTDLATPHSEVSSFCCAVLSMIIPAELWGSSDEGLNINKTVILRSVDQFVRLRKFETLSLHCISQGIKVNLA